MEPAAGERASSRPPGETGSREPPVRVENLVKRYGGEGGVEAVSGVDFEIERGTAVGILGPNGAGKTTTIKCLLGLIIPTAGEARVAGIDVQERPDLAYRKVGATLEGARNMYWRLTVMENLDFFAALAGKDPRDRRERHEELLEQFGIPEKADTVVRELSRGQKQKAALACTLARNADVLFLDEPTLGLDIESSVELRNELRSLVEEGESTVVLSSHDMDVIEDVCDRVIILNDGEIIADDTVENLLHLFDTRRYEITVSGDVPTTLRNELGAEFDADGFETHRNRTRFGASVTGDEFYDLVDQLREASLSVESFDTADADLEKVFLRITGGGTDEAAGGDESDSQDRPVDARTGGAGR